MIAAIADNKSRFYPVMGIYGARKTQVMSEQGVA